MITGLMLIVAYLLPIPILIACFYFHIYSSVDDVLMRLAAIGITSVTPSAIIMLFVLKRILHFVFTILCIAGILFSLRYFGLINFTSH